MKRLEVFHDLPQDLRERIAVIRAREPEQWVLMPMPALDGKSIIEVMNEPGGGARIRILLGQIEGYLGVP
jgi:hypothetical protein